MLRVEIFNRIFIAINIDAIHVINDFCCAVIIKFNCFYTINNITPIEIYIEFIILIMLNKICQFYIG